MASYLPGCSTKDSAGKGRITLERCNSQASACTPDKEQPAHSACRKNITPVSLHKQAVSTGTFAEGLDENEAADPTSAIKKKRKVWTEEEDAELMAAVQKYGEGNWAIILKGEFKHDRTTAQLSKRWSTLKKHTNPGSSRNLSSTTQSHMLLATREAVESAFKMPMARSSPSTHTGAAVSNASKLTSTLSESSPAPASRPQASNPLPSPFSQASLQKEVSTPLNRTQTAPKMTAASTKPPVGPNALIQAAAFAAGGRIAAPSAAATLLKAAQSKVHFMHRGSILMSANKSRSQPNCRQTRPFVKPPPVLGTSSAASDRAKVGSHQAQSSIPVAARADCNNNAGGNAEKIEVDVFVSQNQTKASHASENGRNATKEAEKEKS